MKREMKKKKEVAEWKLSTNNKAKEACAFAEKLRMITRSPYTIEKKKEGAFIERKLFLFFFYYYLRKCPTLRRAKKKKKNYI